MSASVSDRARLAILRQYEILDTAPEAAFDRITRLVASVLRVPVCLISFVDDNRQFFKSAVGLPKAVAAVRETPLSHSLCQYVVRDGKPLVIDDAKRHPLFCNSLAVTELQVAAYAGMPLQTAQGVHLGALCAIATEPRPWLPYDLELLQDFASLVMDELELRVATKRLLQAEASYRNRVKLESVGRLSAGVAHDFNNIVMMILADVDLAREVPSLAPAVQGHLQNIEEAALRAAKVTEQLLAFGRDRPIRRGSIALSSWLVRARPVLLRLVRDPDKLVMDEVSDSLLVRADPDLLTQALVNLVTNAYESMDEARPVCITVSHYQPASGAGREAQEPGVSYVAVKVTDTRVGIPAADLPCIFEPFFTTKAVGKGSGLGLSSAYGIVKQNEGWLEIASEPGKGTTVWMILPLLPGEPAASIANGTPPLSEPPP